MLWSMKRFQARRIDSPPSLKSSPIDCKGLMVTEVSDIVGFMQPSYLEVSQGETSLGINQGGESPRGDRVGVGVIPGIRLFAEDLRIDSKLTAKDVDPVWLKVFQDPETALVLKRG